MGPARAVCLQQLAVSGGICVSRNVYDQVKTKVAYAFEPMGEHAVKNIPETIVVYRVLVDPSVSNRPPPQPSGLEPAEAARQECIERSATAASYFDDLSRQSDGLTTLLGRIRTRLATNASTTEPLWSVAAGAADMIRADDEIENTTADLRAGALSPVEAERRLAAADQKRAAARARVVASLDQLRARIGDLGSDPERRRELAWTSANTESGAYPGGAAGGRRGPSSRPNRPERHRPPRAPSGSIIFRPARVLTAAWTATAGA